MNNTIVEYIHFKPNIPYQEISELEHGLLALPTRLEDFNIKYSIKNSGTQI